MSHDRSTACRTLAITCMVLVGGGVLPAAAQSWHVADGRVTVVCPLTVGGRFEAKTTAVKVTGEQVFGHAKTYALTGASPTPKAGATLTSTAQNAFLYTMPAQSVTVIVPTS